jgi:uncharacterized membrane protein YidH (DUF202 family)
VNPPPAWNIWARVRHWERENHAKAQIAAIMALAIGLIVVMFLVTIVVIARTLGS